MNWKRWLLLVTAVALCFACLVWPTPWKVQVVLGEGNDTGSGYLQRTNRITGVRQLWRNGHWAYVIGHDGKDMP